MSNDKLFKYPGPGLDFLKALGLKGMKNYGHKGGITCICVKDISGVPSE
jgi:hypothetical protein